MTFNPNVPNLFQSPGVFPPQNNNNFARLKAIINHDHQFNDTEDIATDGVHKQVTMIAHPLAVITDVPAGTNAMLYTWIDALSIPQLRYYNGITDIILTGVDELFPLRIVGTRTVASMAPSIAFPDPGYLYAGTGFAIIQGTTTANYYDIILGTANGAAGKIIGSPPLPAAPTLSYSGPNPKDLIITNQSAGSSILVWSLIINRIS